MAALAKFSPNVAVAVLGIASAIIIAIVVILFFPPPVEPTPVPTPRTAQPASVCSLPTVPLEGFSLAANVSAAALPGTGLYHPVPLDSPSAMYLALMPSMMHSQPGTGHTEGNHKADWQLLFHPGRPSMLDLASYSVGCNATRHCGMAEDMLAHARWFIAPEDVEVVQVQVRNDSATHNPQDVFGPITYSVVVAYPDVNGTRARCWLRYHHIQELSPAFVASVISQGFPDPRNTSFELFPPRTLPLLHPARPVIAADTRIGLPQIRATVWPDDTKYIAGWNHRNYPYQQVEIDVSQLVTDPEPDLVHNNVYLWLPSDHIQPFRELFERQALTPLPADTPLFTYAHSATHRWLWASEADLVNLATFTRLDYSSLYSNNGLWTEIDDPNTFTSDEYVVIWPIRKATAVWTAYRSDFVSPDWTSAVIGRLIAPGVMQWGQVVNSISMTDPTGVMDVLWRSTGTGAPDMPIAGPEGGQWQRVAWRRWPVQQVMALRFGSMRDSFVDLDTPAVPSDPGECDGFVTTCYDHHEAPQSLYCCG